MNQVTEKKEGALAVNLFEADAQQGAQNISQEDLALPFLKILGQLSPEVNKRDGKLCRGRRTWQNNKHCYKCIVRFN